MVKKRLDRDYKWYLQEYFQELPYYQMRIDIEEFHGINDTRACLISNSV